MLDRILDFFHIATDDSIERRLRQKEIDAINAQLAEDSQITELRKIPTYSGDVADYIRSKAREFVPAVQFEGASWKDLGVRQEIAGVLGYANGLHELSFTATGKGAIVEVPLPSRGGDGERVYVSEKVWCEVYGGGPVREFSIRSTTHQELHLEAVLSVDEVVLWHTHPDKYVAPSRRDAQSLKLATNFCEGRPVYSVIYSPRSDSMAWYKLGV